VGHKKRATFLLSISLPIIVDRFSVFFTATLCRQFAIMLLLYMSPHHKCVSTLPCEIQMKYQYIMITTDKTI